jgi:ethanolamine utilization protein EutA
MPGLVPGIHVFLVSSARRQDVDGRAKPGHDDEGRFGLKGRQPSMAAADDKEEKAKHTLADHLLGQDFVHDHDGDADHDHDHFELDPDERLEDNPIWIQDHVTLVSVGIDIGSAGTQVIFSRINLRRYGEDLTSRYTVVSRETLYQSPVALTPYQSDERIDDGALGAIIDEAYAAAAIRPEDIDTGVVILTGEALRRENAQAIAGLLAEQRGDFVTATAGHHMESMLAAYGSGAARISHDEGKRVLNIDIGGGTTKLALVENGNVVATAAVHIGGRLQVVDEIGRIVRLDPAGRYHAREAGYYWSRGDVLSPPQLDKVAEHMADALVAAVTQRPIPHAIAHLYLTDPLADLGRIDGVMFSGGVGEYVYGRESRDFGDMGRRLGQAIRRRIDGGKLPWPLLPAGECIRATALGASEYSVQLSGNTSTITNPAALLPRRNLQVVQPSYDCGEVIDPQALAKAIRAHFTAFDLVEGEGDVALALRWAGAPSYERIAAFADGIRRGLATTIERKKPLYLMLDGDVAQTLGAILREELKVESEILAIDGVMLRDFDYIDLGKIRLPSYTVPVTIKSLVFSEDPRGGRPPQRIHHHEHGHGHDHHDHGYGDGHHHHHDHAHGHDHHHDHGHGNHHHHDHAHHDHDHKPDHDHARDVHSHKHEHD